ncbi:MAG: hypothetical protein H0X25_14790 [Acidobacteriales bacterium]|nr:hypothetical protein [Terriglobales bacterium]
MSVLTKCRFPQVIGATLCVIALSTLGFAASENILLALKPSQGTYPLGVIFDADGNLFGTAYNGGEYGTGSVYELTLSGGVWTETAIHQFGAGQDGKFPVGIPVFDKAGNLYGTTPQGGSYGCGIAFELSPQGNGVWSEQVLHQFACGIDGNAPDAGLMLDTNGNLFGASGSGGTDGYGVAFELSPLGGGRWKKTVLHNFGAQEARVPGGLLAIDNQGNVYGSTYYGGPSNTGAIFEISPLGNTWKEKVLHYMGGLDGSAASSVVVDSAGNLFATAGRGGKYNRGTIFELSPAAGGSWKFVRLYDFGTNPEDGECPQGLLPAPDGSFFGTNEGLGDFGFGTVFQFSPTGEGEWTETVLHSFNYGRQDGGYPQGPLVLDKLGNVYGTTVSGGPVGSDGLVYEITP